MINEATIKAIQDTMRKDVGVDGDAQRLGQLVWMIFLKVFDDREQEWETFDASYRSPIPEPLRWRSWAADAEGRTGAELLAFIDSELFPALKALAASPKPAAALVGEAFEDAYNYMKSGTLLRQVINRINSDLNFNRRGDRQALGDLYEQLLKGLQSAGDSGEYYTPRAVVQFMVGMVDPKLGETILDPACGTGGFLTAALDHVRDQYVARPEDEQLLQRSIHGVEKKPLPHLLCLTNLILHGIDVPSSVKHGNALARPLRDYGPRDRVDVIVTNPPFRGMEADGVENNFPASIRTKETADLFLALVLHLLKPGGRAAIVLPDSSLFAEGVKETLRQRLMHECDLHTIVRLPHGVFSPYTDIRTNLLFFTKRPKTSSVWFYEQLCPFGEKYTKTKPIAEPDFEAARLWWPAREDTERAWNVSASAVAERGFNLLVDNPHREDVGDAYRRTLAAREGLVESLEEMRLSIPETLEQAEWPVRGDVEQFFTTVAEMSPYVSLTSGVMEQLRRAVTDLAIRGEMSQPEADDEDVEATVARYTPSTRKLKDFLHVEPPFEVPEQWSWRRLADLGEFAIGRTPPTKDSRYWVPNPESGDGYAWVAIGDMPRRGSVLATDRRITDLGRDVFKRDPVPAGALLVAFKLSVGKTALLGLDAFHNEAIASFQVDDDALRAYLMWALPALVTHAAVNPAIMGSTLNSKSIAALWVPIPPSQEQGRIVAALDWSAALLDSISDASEAVRRESDRAVKLLAHERALSRLKPELTSA